MSKLVSILLGILIIGSTDSATAGMKVRMGTEGAYPPFNYTDSSGELKGFDIDIGNAICAAAKFECTWVAQDWDGIIPGLLSKKFDTIIASMSITEERKKKVDFSVKYYSGIANFFAKKGADYTISKTGLRGKSIGVQRGTIHENFLRDNYAGVANIKSYSNQEEVYLDLAAGRIDLGLADKIAVSNGFLKVKAGKDFELIGPDLTDPKWFGDGVGIAVRKGDTKLLTAINEAIELIIADGIYKKINDMYFDFNIYGD